MKEIPVLFSTPMVRAILDGTKTQTRRVIKPQPLENTNGYLYKGAFWGFGEIVPQKMIQYAPYKPGDILWVRETWNKNPRSEPDNMHALGYCGHCSACLNIDDVYIYKATFTKNEDGKTLYPCNAWKPSIHMPREAARIFLKVKSVRIERLQDITEQDAVKEGITQAVYTKQERQIKKTLSYKIGSH